MIKIIDNISIYDNLFNDDINWIINIFKKRYIIKKKEEIKKL